MIKRLGRRNNIINKNIDHHLTQLKTNAIGSLFRLLRRLNTAILQYDFEEDRAAYKNRGSLYSSVDAVGDFDVADLKLHF